MEIFLSGRLQIVKNFGSTESEGFIIKKGISDGRVWIERQSGEGGDFDAKEFYDLIERFYNERF